MAPTQRDRLYEIKMLPMPIGQLHGRVVNPGLVEEERRRRISVLRFGFLACFVLLVRESSFSYLQLKPLCLIFVFSIDTQAFGHSGNKTQSNLRGLSNEKKEVIYILVSVLVSIKFSQMFISFLASFLSILLTCSMKRSLRISLLRLRRAYLAGTNLRHLP